MLFHHEVFTLTQKLTENWVKDNTTNIVNSRVDVYLVKNYQYSQFYIRHHIKIHQVMTHLKNSEEADLQVIR